MSTHRSLTNLYALCMLGMSKKIVSQFYSGDLWDAGCLTCNAPWRPPWLSPAAWRPPAPPWAGASRPPAPGQPRSLLTKRRSSSQQSTHSQNLYEIWIVRHRIDKMEGDDNPCLALSPSLSSVAEFWWPGPGCSCSADPRCRDARLEHVDNVLLRLFVTIISSSHPWHWDTCMLRSGARGRGPDTCPHAASSPGERAGRARTRASRGQSSQKLSWSCPNHFYELWSINILHLSA